MRPLDPDVLPTPARAPSRRPTTPPRPSPRRSDRSRHAALGRNETTPGRRATAGGGTVTPLADPDPAVAAPGHRVPGRAVEAALPGLLPALLSRRRCSSGTATRSGPRSTYARYAGGERARWVVSDLTPGLDGAPNQVEPDHVLGVSSASTSLSAAHRAPAGRTRPRPRHRLRGPGAAAEPTTPPRWSPPTSTTGPCSMARATAALNGVAIDVRARQPLRARRRRAVRPGREQPALRGLPARRRAPGLPGLRAARRRGGAPRGHRGAAAPGSRRRGAGAGQLGARRGAAVGGAARRLVRTAPAATRGWCSARSLDPARVRRAVAARRRGPRPARLRRALRRLAGVVRRAGRRGDRASAG